MRRVFGGFGLVLACAAAMPALADAADLRFNRDIRPILSEHCFACHGPDSASRKADLRLDRRAAAVELGAIVPSKPDHSELVRRVFSSAHDDVMPPPETKRTLTAGQKELLKRWVAEGAEYESHWSFLRVPKEVPVPVSVEANDWGRTSIDAFVLDRLQEEKLQPAEEATREKWIRRVSFDLTGLPPTLAEIDAFLADDSATAFDNVVDRLLASPAYGERMANDWLDVARYADTFGYQADRNMHMSPWRDWVIRAFNENLPYSDFIVWQLSGDMLENPTRDQRLATAFNRLHRQTNEGGSIEEEFRVEYVADRVRTMGSAFLGLTFECARCHDHKYDPITQREYYSLTAFFNNIDEHGLYSHFTETAPTPTLLLYEGDQQSKHRELLARIAAAEEQLREAIAQAFKKPAPLPADAIAAPDPEKVYTFDDVPNGGDFRGVEGHAGRAIEFGGDDQFVCKEAPQLSRSAPFSLSLWVKPGPHGPRQIVFHQSRAAEDSAFRGVSLTIDNGRPTFSMVHFWPGNALQIRTQALLAPEVWTQLVITSDGSGRAAGTTFYVNGVAAEVEVVGDRLTRDVIHRAEWGDSEAKSIPFALGARFRDLGFKGGCVDELEFYSVALTEAEVAFVSGRADLINDSQRQDHHARRIDTDVVKIEAELRALRVEENTLIGRVRQIMTMQELPSDRRRLTYRLDRGAYDGRAETVVPATPVEIFTLPEGSRTDRLGFARALIDDRNPLTARVAVNRYWAMFFGTGLVATTQDFGSQGEPPSHPELLDWLARDFMDHGWNVQRLFRQIVLSATYRQSSTPRDPKLYASDPANRLLARGPRHRLPAEQIRDNALAISGLLKPRVGGDSVFPYQPAGLWEEAGTGKSYSQSHGDDLYRRSLYTFWRRTSPPPTMTAFDAPSREYCVIQRERTATPLQALTLLNDPQFVEAARVLASNVLSTMPRNDDAGLVRVFRWTTSRQPTVTEQEILQSLLAAARVQFAGNEDAAKALVSVGESPVDKALEVAELAAWTSVVQSLLGFDECLTKR
ncbi:Planctomycete cytochrome C [Caulifigura coniformis]|uniref:Planctomycete cytochrome C n=1 Tax=Caulifigura coniformis TaxID=2527983 RepID=A0A517SH60_9PLAN|nr:DUF1553 domain-containing protein [Caulifigura coniformis]QDT55461.1 Planctomycete cytochrome C [Caulifigura coniformis]